MEKAVVFLKKNKRFAPIIKKHGFPELKRGRNAFQALVRSIIYQQVTGKAAASILNKFVLLFSGKKFPEPIDVSKISLEKLHSAGLSQQKVSYIKDLAGKFLDGTIENRKLPKMTNDEVIEHLVQVKGIGVWTAHMFLIFTLNRPDILPTGDLGIQKGFKILYGLKNLPNHKKMEKLAKPWRKHASVASWYLWRVADEVKGKVIKKKKQEKVRVLQK